MSPSLYTVKLYVTTLPVFTTTGSFLCLYVAVVPVSNVDKSIFGTLEFTPLNSTPSTLVTYLLNAKSNSFTCSGNFSIKIIGCTFVSVALVYKVTLVFEVAVPFSYVIAFLFAV